MVLQQLVVDFSILQALDVVHLEVYVVELVFVFLGLFFDLFF